MNIDLIINYISYVILAISIIVTVFNLIDKIKNGKKMKDTNKEIEEIKSDVTNREKLIKVITKIIPNAIKLAENSGVNNGATKKLLALSEVLLQCSKDDFNFEENRQVIDETIEDFVKMTNEVNIGK